MSSERIASVKAHEPEMVLLQATVLSGCGMSQSDGNTD